MLYQLEYILLDSRRPCRRAVQPPPLEKGLHSICVSRCIKRRKSSYGKHHELFARPSTIDFHVWNFFSTFAGPIATIIASGAALVVTWRFGTMQADLARTQANTAKSKCELRIQKNIAAARLNFDLYEKRYAVFDAARRLLIKVVQHDNVESTEVIKFNIETADAVFLFNKDIDEYLESLRNKILRLRVLDEAGDEQKRNHLIDLESNLHIALSNELPTMVEKFKPYLRLGNV